MLQIIGPSSSINVRKVLWTCAELNLLFEHEQWSGATRPPEQPESVAWSPSTTVPILVDSEVALWESNTICRYLAALYGDGGLLPAPALARAKVEQWMDWQATELNNLSRYAFMGLVRHSSAHQDLAQIEASAADWNWCLGMLEQQLAATGPFVTGAQFTLADIALGLSINRWRMTPIERPAYPALAAYYERLGERKGFQEYCANGLA